MGQSTLPQQHRSANVRLRSPGNFTRREQSGHKPTQIRAQLAMFKQS